MIIGTNNKTNVKIADFSFDKTVSMTNTDGQLSVNSFKSLFSITSNNFIIQNLSSAIYGWEYTDTFLSYGRYALVTEDKPNVFQIYYNGAYVGDARYISVASSTTHYIYNLI